VRRRLDLQEAWLWTRPIWAFGAARTIVMLLAVLTDLAVANEACATGGLAAGEPGA
jgi:hypothetical protein